MPTADLLGLAEVLDTAGFACLEVSGGGVFDSAVRRGVESPWERIRALKLRTKTPGLPSAVASSSAPRPVARRFRPAASSASAAENGIDVFRLHDPLNDVSNLREAGEESLAAPGGNSNAGLVYSPVSQNDAVHAARRAGEAAWRARREPER